MSLTIPDVASWDLATVAEHLATLSRDTEVFLDSAAAIRSAGDAHVGEALGETATSARRGCADVAKSLSLVGRKTEGVVEALATFSEQAPAKLGDLVALVDAAVAASCSVQDDGTVLGPRVVGDPADPGLAKDQERLDRVAEDFEAKIVSLLRELEHLDLEAANALNLMAMAESYEFYPHEPEDAGSDPLTTAAGIGMSGGSEIVGKLAEARGLASGFARGIPIAGTVAGMALGTATRPDGESVPESLAAEAAGAAVGAAGGMAGGMVAGMAAGAAFGSIVPGIGTVAGLIVGAGAGAYLGSKTAETVREQFAEQRADGKEDFRW